MKSYSYIYHLSLYLSPRGLWLKLWKYKCHQIQTAYYTSKHTNRHYTRPSDSIRFLPHSLICSAWYIYLVLITEYSDCNYFFFPPTQTCVNYYPVPFVHIVISLKDNRSLKQFNLSPHRWIPCNHQHNNWNDKNTRPPFFITWNSYASTVTVRRVKMTKGKGLINFPLSVTPF